MNALSVQNLVKQYGWFFSRRKVVAVDHLSLDVEEKQIFGFLGPNGAGKTTTIKILLGLVIPDSGNASIFETAVTDKAIKSRVGFLPDSPCFYNHLTGREFIAFCGKLMHLDRMERYRRADELLVKVGLEEAGDQKIEGYSRGMLQRLGIAQALINNPDLVILDEPVNGLDPLGRREVKQILIDLQSEGKTIFFSSHILADVQEMCQNIAILNHGRVLIKGAVEDILQAKGQVIWVAGLAADAVEKAAGLAPSISKRGDLWGFELTEVTTAARERVTEFVGKHGGRVEEVNTKKESLEESFLRRIEEDEKKFKEGKGK